MLASDNSRVQHQAHQSARRRLAHGTLLALLLGISYLQLDIISEGFVSLFLTPLSLVAEPGAFGRFQVSRLLEYWIAAIAWMLALAILLRGTLLKEQNRPETKAKGMQRFLWATRLKARGIRHGVRAILLFSFVAAAAPFLAPWDPAAQGALPVTRLLPPLSHALYVEYTTVPDSPAGGWIAARAINANNYLLNRMVKFSALESDQALSAQFPEGAHQRKYGKRLFLLGSDHLGRDLLSRIIYGSRISLGIALVAALSAVAAGAFFGFVAGSIGGLLERVLMRLLDVLLAIPSLFFILAVVAFLGSNILMMTGVLIALGWMTPARIVRAEVASLREREDILSARLLGVPTRRIVMTHVLPNTLPVILTALLLQFSTMVLAEATLSFLGLGVQPPTPSWGGIIGEATGYLHVAWWIALFPGIVISSLIIAAHGALEGWQREQGS